jgi:hypothetical protein
MAWQFIPVPITGLGPFDGAPGRGADQRVLCPTGVTASINSVAANGAIGAVVLGNSDGSDISVGRP